jgi:hypothetical protein
MKKVIFVPGFYGGKYQIWLIKIILKNFELIYFQYNTTLKESIEKIAKQLKNFINNLKLNKEEKVDIIGLSAGGIIIDYYLKFIDNKKINKFISICSPFKGTYLANIYSLFLKSKGLQQLKSNSIFLKELFKKRLNNIKVENIWCLFDLIVPGTSAKGINPKHTYFFLHWFIQYWPPVIFEIKRFLNEKNEK